MNSRIDLVLTQGTGSMGVLEVEVRSLLAEAEAYGHALRSRSVGFAETLPERSVALWANRF
ncbi:MAG: hypothetical protein F6K65_26490 [Moorea sp. SIO3C2]|nr:hypothetical protein [Moorena sp. SIO3C2]